MGNPVRYSLSPLMHSAAYQAAGLQDTFCFSAVTVAEDSVQQALDGCSALGVRGLSVTQPFKEAVIPFLDNIDDEARAIGCVNTIVFDGDKRNGSNTDWRGIVDPLEQRTSLQDQSCLVIGAGGAARAAVYGLTRAGARVSIMNRTEERAKELANEFGVTAVSFQDKEAITSAGVLVQTTSVGLGNTTDCPIDTTLLHDGQLVFDAIYNPLQTRLLSDAIHQGARVVEGVEMFVAQGAAQFSLYTNTEAPREAMRTAVLNYLRETQK